MAGRQVQLPELMFRAWLLGFDALTVVWLRSVRIGAGGAVAEREAQRMVGEKVSAAAEAQWRLASGAFGLAPLSILSGLMQFYAPRVRSNRRRLTRK